MADSSAPAPTTLAALQSLLSSQITSANQLAVSEANTGIAGLTNLLNQTIGTNLVITITNPPAISGSSLSLTGSISLFSASFQVSLTFTQAGSSFSLSFSATQTANTVIGVRAVISRVIPTANNAPTLNLTGLQVTFNTADSSFLFTGSLSSWQVNVANQTLTITPTLTIAQSGGTLTAVLTGTLLLGTSTFNVTFTIGKSPVLTGSWQTSGQALGWSALLNALNLSSSVTIPSSFPTGGLISAQFTLDTGSHAFNLAGQTANGDAFFSATRAGNWSVVFGVAVANNWTLSQLSSAFTPLNALQFPQAYLVVSSSEQKQYPLPGTDVTSTQPITIDLEQGLNFGAELSLAGKNLTGLPKALASVLGTSTLSLGGSVGSNTQLCASVDESISVGSGLTISAPELVILASPFTAEVQGTLAVPMGKSQSPIDFTGRLAISPTEADFTLDVGGSNGQSLPSPFGFTGVTLQNIGISLGIKFTPPGIDLAMEAMFTINGSQGLKSADKCALEFEIEPDAVNPILLWGQFSTLSFPLVFSAFLPMITLPGDFSQLTLQNVLVYYCEQPTVLPDNTSATPGFAISGTLIAFGFTTVAALNITFKTGISGSAAMSAINFMNGAVTVTGHSKLGGPQVAFSTLSSPYLNVTLDAKVLDVVGVGVNATITSTGFSFHLALVAQGSGDADGINTTLSCWFSDPQNFGATATLGFNLHFSAGPVMAPGTNVSLGSINISAQFSGTLSFSVTPVSITGSVNGNFNGRSLPAVSINTPTAQLTAIPSMVVQQIRSNISSIYKDLLGNATSWANAVSSGVITGVNDAGSVLTGFFGESSDAAKALMKSLGLHGTLPLHGDIAASHQDAAAQHGDVAGTHADVNLPHVDGAHVDGHVPLIGHDDTHDDTGGHGDTNLTPHGDGNATPHVDTSTPHGDGTTTITV